MNEEKNRVLSKRQQEWLDHLQTCAEVTQEQLMDIQNRLNQRPRKLLGFRAPEEVYTEMTLAA